MFGSGDVRGEGLVDKMIGLRLYQSCGRKGSVGRVSVLWWCMLGLGGVVLRLCESGLFVYMASPGICILC